MVEQHSCRKCDCDDEQEAAEAQRNGTFEAELSSRAPLECVLQLHLDRPAVFYEGYLDGVVEIAERSFAS